MLISHKNAFSEISKARENFLSTMTELGTFAQRSKSWKDFGFVQGYRTWVIPHSSRNVWQRKLFIKLRRESRELSDCKVITFKVMTTVTYFLQIDLAS
jgi:hypothetical protein